MFSSRFDVCSRDKVILITIESSTSIAALESQHAQDFNKLPLENAAAKKLLRAV